MTFPIGRCKDKCPSSERKRREREKRLHQFEILDGTELSAKPSADVNKTIKEFQRSAAGKKLPEPEEIRPPQVLKDTMIYMMEHILTRNDVPWIVIYDYIFDRIRAVRQELILQQIWNQDSLNILEIAVRFYLYSPIKAREMSCSGFNHHINYNHLQQCMKHLIVLLQENKKSSDTEEIIAFYLLHNMNSFEAVNYTKSLPEDIRNCSYIKNSLEICTYRMFRNYRRVLKLIADLPPLQACATVNSIEEIQREALQIMNFAYSTPNCKYPIDRLRAVLLFDDDEKAAAFCSRFGIQIIDSNVCFSKKNYKSCNENDELQRFRFIDDKLRHENVPELIIGKKEK